MEDCTDWSSITDPSGKIFRAPPEHVLGGDLVCETIASWVVRGRAKVLHDSYEKPMKNGEILISPAT